MDGFDRQFFGDSSRSRRLAGHYTVPGQSSSKLGPTARLAAAATDFPAAQVNVLDFEHQYTLTDFGHSLDTSDGPFVMDREQTMCNFTVFGEEPLAVGDLTEVPEYAALPGVRAGMARSYLGVPLRSRESQVIGTLCVTDVVPRHISAAQVLRLREFARIIEDQLDVIRRANETGAQAGEQTAKLVRAIKRAEIVPWYQPVVDLATGRPRSYEALARWVHPTGEIEDPGVFVPLAEDSDLVIDLDLAIMRQALRDLRRWRGEGHDLHINVNISTRHLEAPDGAAAICAVAAHGQVDPGQVVLELTESHRLSDVARAAESVRQLRSAGFSVLLDDFGSGWSSLDWVMTLPVTGLKMDRSVSAALDSRAGQAVTRAAMGLAADLDLTLVLEGVSSRRIVTSALAQGYRYGQGHLFTPPVPADMIDAQLSADTWASTA